MDELIRMERGTIGAIYAIMGGLLLFCLADTPLDGNILIFVCWSIGLLGIIGYIGGWDIRVKEWRERGFEIPNKTNWIDWNCVKTFSLKKAFISRLNLLFWAIVALMMVVAKIDYILNMPSVFQFHYLPEMVGFFVVGMWCYRLGLRNMGYVVFLLYGVMFFINVGVISSDWWAIPAIMTFPLMSFAGHCYEKRAKNPMSKRKKMMCACKIKEGEGEGVE